MKTFIFTALLIVVSHIAADSFAQGGVKAINEHNAQIQLAKANLK